MTNQLIPEPPASVQDDADLAAVRRLRSKLDALIPPSDSVTTWNRRLATQVLDAAADHFGDLTDVPTGDSGTAVVMHLATNVLQDLAMMLRDLDHGQVDNRLKPPKGLGGAALGTNERQLVTGWLAFVNALRHCKGMTVLQAEKAVAHALKEEGVRFRGRPVTATNLASWRRARPGKR